MLACTNEHGEEVIDCLHAETLSIEVGESGRNCTGSLRGFLHCCVFTKKMGMVSLSPQNVTMSSEAAECGLDLVEATLETRDQDTMPSTHGFWKVGA